MSQIGTFGMFTTARLGIYTSQQGLNLTGNNISNMNTTGYTRQTLDIKSMVSGVSDRYSSSAVRIGNGAYAYGISQMRDPYLDIRYRTECASVGFMDTKQTHLNDLAAILDEVGDGEDDNGVISSQLSELLSAMQNLTQYTGQGEFDTQVCASAEALVKLFNSYATRLETAEEGAVDSFKDEMNTINNLLSNIQQLTVNIRKSDIHGNPSLEMRDERNNLIDELSEHLKIDVRYETEQIAPGVEIERLTIKLADHDVDNPIYLIHGEYAAQLELDKDMPEVNPDYDGVTKDTTYIMRDDDGKITGYTDDPKQANRVENTNYNLTLSSLKDTKGNVKCTYDAEKIYTGSVAASPDPNNVDVKNSKNETISVDISTYLTTMNAHGSSQITWLGQENADGTQNEYTLTKAKDKDGNDIYNVTLAVRTNDLDKALDDNDLYGRLQATREFLTEEGEFASAGYINAVDANAATKRGVHYYRQALDLLVNKFATTMNAANNGFRYTYDATDSKYYYVDVNGDVIEKDGAPMEKKAPEDLTEEEREYLTNNGAGNISFRVGKNPGDDTDTKLYYVNASGALITGTDGKPIEKVKATDLMSDANTALRERLIEYGCADTGSAGNLFSVRGDCDDDTDADGNGITASNISISKSWANHSVQIINSYEIISGENKVGTTDNSNILHFVNLLTKDLDYNPSDITNSAKDDSMFTGSFGEMLGNINAVLGRDQYSTQLELDNYYTAALELDTSRDSVSSVDLNDETVNMIQYQKAYSAACRIMTAMDEIIDKLINSTGTAGR